MSNEQSHDNIKNAPKQKQKVQNKERKEMGFDGIDGKQKTSNYILWVCLIFEGLMIRQIKNLVKRTCSDVYFP